MQWAITHPSVSQFNFKSKDMLEVRFCLRRTVCSLILVRTRCQKGVQYKLELDSLTQSFFTPLGRSPIITTHPRYQR